MHTFLRFALRAVLLAAGFWLAGTAASSAANATQAVPAPPALPLPLPPAPALPAPPTEALAPVLFGVVLPALASPPVPSGGLPDGTLIAVNVAAPVSLCGSSVAVVGDADSTCEQPASKLASGTTNDAVIDLNVVAPVNACGTSVAVVGNADTTCTSPSTATTPTDPTTPTVPVVPSTSTLPVQLAGPSGPGAPELMRRISSSSNLESVPSTSAPLGVEAMIGLLLLTLGLAIDRVIGRRIS